MDVKRADYFEFQSPTNSKSDMPENIIFSHTCGTLPDVICITTGIGWDLYSIHLNYHRAYENHTAFACKLYLQSLNNYVNNNVNYFRSLVSITLLLSYY